MSTLFNGFSASSQRSNILLITTNNLRLRLPNNPMKKPIFVHVDRCKFAAKESNDMKIQPNQTDIDCNSNLETGKNQRYNLRSTIMQNISMIQVIDEMEKTILSSKQNDCHVEEIKRK